MKTVSISGSPRESVGKRDARKSRNQGKIPCVMYGGEEQKFFTVDVKALEKLLYSPFVHFIEVEVDGKKHNTIIQEVQFHPVTDKILHVDLLEFFPDKQIVMEIPLKVLGTAPGVQKGGVLLKKLRKVRVRALPEFMPENIEVDISELEINDTIHISDLPQENREYIANQDAFVIGVGTTRMALPEEEEEEAEEGAEGEEEGAAADETPEKPAE